MGALSGALAKLQANRPLRELREIAKGITKQLPENVQEATAKIDECVPNRVSKYFDTRRLCPCPPVIALTSAVRTVEVFSSAEFQASLYHRYTASSAQLLMLTRSAVLRYRYARGLISGPGSTLFEELGLYYIGPIDGHNLGDLIGVLRGKSSAASRYTSHAAWLFLLFLVNLHAAWMFPIGAKCALLGFPFADDC